LIRDGCFVVVLLLERLSSSPHKILSHSFIVSILIENDDAPNATESESESETETDAETDAESESDADADDG